MRALCIIFLVRDLADIDLFGSLFCRELEWRVSPGKGDIDVVSSVEFGGGSVLEL